MFRWTFRDDVRVKEVGPDQNHWKEKTSYGYCMYVQICLVIIATILHEGDLSQLESILVKCSLWFSVTMIFIHMMILHFIIPGTGAEKPIQVYRHRTLLRVASLWVGYQWSMFKETLVWLKLTLALFSYLDWPKAIQTVTVIILLSKAITFLFFSDTS